MFNKVCRIVGVPPKYCLIFIVILFSVLAFLLYKYVIKNKEGMQNGKKSMVYCWMEGCGHCKNFNPTWDQFMNGSKLPTLNYAKIESREDPKFMQKMGVQGFPTILGVDENGDKMKEYNGDRSLESLRDFANEIYNH